MCHGVDEPSEEDLERQKQLEADAVQNGIARLVQSLKHRRNGKHFKRSAPFIGW